MFHRKDIVFNKPSVFQVGIEEYAEAHSSPPPAETSMIYGRTQDECPEWADIATTALQLTFLRMLTSMVGARRALEVGTFTGHAALGIAGSLPDDGEIVTLDNFIADERARQIAKAAFGASPHGRKITLIEGDALESLNELKPAFDLIFVDADKPNYVNYYRTIMDRQLLADDGLMIFDNTLWGGMVVQPVEALSVAPIEAADDGDEWLRRMHADWGRHVVEFNDHVTRDPRVDNVLLTVRDGMTLIRRAR